MERRLIVPQQAMYERVDRWIVERVPELSRSRIQVLIKAEQITVNGRPAKAHQKVAAGDEIGIVIPAPEPARLTPEPIPLDVLYEDCDIICVNKPPGLVVHPAPGNPTGTLVNALLFHCRELGSVGGVLRPGIVHRLDKDTSGAMVAAKNDAAMSMLVRQFKRRSVDKEYSVLVWGRPRPAARRIETVIGRSRHNRKKMAANSRSGRSAVTTFETVETFGKTTLLKARIETGRTHQIRVHLSHIGHPVVGDTVYGRSRNESLPVEPGRQMLHAARLGFLHPKTGKPMNMVAPVPADMAGLLEALRQERDNGK